MVTPHDLIIRNVFVSCVLVSLLGSGITPASAQVLPPIITPSPGSTLTSTTVTFTGGHASQPGEEHWLSVGFGTRIWEISSITSPWARAIPRRSQGFPRLELCMCFIGP